MVSKKRAAKFVRNVAISVVVIIAVLVGAGALYTWLMGRNTPADTKTNVTEDKPAPVLKRAATDPNAPETASVQTLTTPVMPGDNASITVKTNQGSWCTITAEYNKVPSKDSGLIGKTADEFGSVTWTWTVDASAPDGKWPVKVTCIRNSKSAVVIADLVVAKTITEER